MGHSFPEGAAGTKAGASGKWPDKYSWMDYNMRHDLTSWLSFNRWKRDGKGPTSQELQNRIKSVQREQNIRDNVKMEPEL